MAGWWGMLDVCEAVIAEQSDVPLRDYTPAPFTFGKPGVKQYSVFDATGDLVVTAVLKNEVWVECRVGEHDASSPDMYIGDPVKAWTEAFASRFPSPRYKAAEYRVLAPGRINPIAIRCEGVALPYQVSAVWALWGALPFETRLPTP